MAEWECEKNVGFCHASRIQTVSLGLAAASFSFLVNLLFLLMLNEDDKIDSIHKTGTYIRRGAKIFIASEYRYLTGFSLIMWILLVAFYCVIPTSGDATDGIRIGACFLIGFVSSASAGYAGFKICLRATVRITRTTQELPLRKVLSLALTGGSVLSTLGASFCLFGISFLFYLMRLGRQEIYTDYALSETVNKTLASEAIVGFGLGASMVALFSRVSGGIFASAANITSQIVQEKYDGDIDRKIGHDDLKNPLFIARKVGACTSGALGMAADLCQSFVATIIAAAIIAEGDTVLLCIPFWIAGSGAIASVLGYTCIKLKDDNATHKKLVWAFRKGIIVSSLFVATCSAVIVSRFFDNHVYGWKVFGCIAIGLVAGILIDFTTDIFTSPEYYSVKSIVSSGVTGPATVVIQGLGIGMISCFTPVIILFITILACNILAGQYGIAMSAVAMTSTFGLTVGINAMQCITNNVKSIANVAELDDGALAIADSLDNVVTALAAPGKGAAIGSAILSSLSLFYAYKHKADVHVVDLGDSYVMAGVLYGSMLPFLFSALTILSVQKTAVKLVDAACTRPARIAGQPGGEALAVHALSCVEIATKASLQETILLGVIAIMSPLTVGFLVGPTPLAGMLAGAIASGMMLAFMMSNAGGAWDNSKNSFETEEACENKGTDTHKACIVGDSVGYLFKDNSAPALNVLIKLMCMVALTIAPVIKGWENWEYFYIGFFPIVVCIATTYYINTQAPFHSNNAEITGNEEVVEN